jgi:hypothetical protein
MKTESEVLEELFNEESAAIFRARWAEEKISQVTAETLPNSELALVREIALRLKDKVVYLKAEATWYIWDGTEFVKSEGDWFIHKVIKEVADIYGEIAERVFKHCTGLQRVKPDDREFDFFSEHLSLNKKLHSASSLNALTTLLKSELDEVPDGLVQSVPFLTFEDLDGEEVVPAFVDGYLPSEGIGQLYGDSYTGKTMAMVDLALSVAAGHDTWQGKTLNTKGPSQVLYVLAEGKASFRDAVKDWQKANPAADVSGLHVHDLTGKATLNITHGEPAPGVYGLADLRAQCKAEGIKPTLMILDPQANILAGVNEDSNSEMVAALTPVQKWSNEDGFLTLLIHHSGKKDKSEGRGASAQKAMMDVLINISIDGDLRTLSFEKVKGSPKPEQKLSFRIIDGVVAPSGGILSGAEKSYLETSMNRSKVIQYLKDGINNVEKLYTASQISRPKLREILADLDKNGVAADLGSKGHPNWVLLGDS